MPRPAIGLTSGAFLLLAACATPQQSCINSVTRDLRIVNNLIADVEITLARGYGIEEVVVVVPGWGYCGGPAVMQGYNGAVIWPGQMCMDNQAQTVRRAVAIDLEAERRKLAGLKAQRAKLSKQAEPAVAQCRQMYPQ